MRDVEDTELATRVHEALLSQRLTVACAESLTGGGLGDLLSSTSGASATYRGGVVPYATDVKQTLLGVSDELVEVHGVVSAECAARMAGGVRTLLGSDFGVSTTGVAGPLPQEDKVPGTVYVAVAGPNGVRAHALHLHGDRREIRERTCRAALVALLDALGDE